MSDDLFVSKEVFEVGDLSISRHAHDDDGDGAVPDHVCLEISLLDLQFFLENDTGSEFHPSLFDHIFDTQCLNLDGLQVLSLHDI